MIVESEPVVMTLDKAHLWRVQNETYDLPPWELLERLFDVSLLAIQTLGFGHG